MLEQIPVDDPEDRPAEPDRRVVVEHRPRGSVVEQDLAVNIADQHRDSELGHERGQSVPLLLQARLRLGDLGGDLALSDATPFGEGLHGGGELPELVRAGPVHPMVRVGLEQQAGLGGEASRRGGVATDQPGDQYDSPTMTRASPPGAAAWPPTTSIKRFPLEAL